MVTINEERPPGIHKEDVVEIWECYPKECDGCPFKIEITDPYATGDSWHKEFECGIIDHGQGEYSDCPGLESKEID